MSKIATFEEALREWREAQTTVEALKAFQENGGQYRLRMRTDSNDPVIGGIMDRLMQGKGYAAFLNKAIEAAKIEAENASRHFHNLSMEGAFATVFNSGDAPL